MHTSLGGTERDEKRSYVFLGRPVGRLCLCEILGIGAHRFRRCQQMIPDMRFGKKKSGSQPNTASVDAFLSILYASVAETMPDQFLAHIYHVCQVSTNFF